MSDKNFKVALVLALRDRVEEDLGIDLVNTVTDVVRVAPASNTVGGYRGSNRLTIYDITGEQQHKKYFIRCHTRVENTIIEPPVVDSGLKSQYDMVYAYNVFLDKDFLNDFPSIDLFPEVNSSMTLEAEDFCRQARNLKLRDLLGNPLCATIGQLPSIVLLPGPSEVVRGTTWQEPGYTATDAEDGDLTLAVNITGSVNTSSTGTYSLVYSVRDSDDQTVSVIRQVNVVLPNKPPVITMLPYPNGAITPLTLIEGVTWEDPGATADDPEEGDLTSRIIKTGVVDTGTVGTYTIRYEVTDLKGDTTYADRVITVVANTMPVINLLPYPNGETSPISVPKDTPYVDPGATATDAEDGDLTDRLITTNDTIDTAVMGNYTITYSVTDDNMGTTQAHRIVNVRSNTLPEITLLPDYVNSVNPVHLVRGDAYVDPGYTATDAEDGDISNRVVITGDVVDNTQVGDYNVTYTVSDLDGNTSSISRIVRVIMPHLTIVLNDDATGTATPIYHLQNTPFVDPGATVTSDLDGDISDRVVVGGTVDVSADNGSNQQLTYMATDQYGVSTPTLNRVVTIVINPVITLLESNGVTTPLNHIDGSVYQEAGATAVDFAGNDITNDLVIGGDTIDSNTAVGNYDITYTVTDSLGHTSVAHRVVNVLANDVPIVTLNEFEGNTTPLNLAYGYSFTDPGATATDTQQGDITADIVVTGDTVDTNTSGTYTITYTVTDASGASTSVSRIINVAANQAPSITLNPYNGVTTPVTLYTGTAFPDPGAVVMDPEEGDISNTVQITGILNVNAPGDYTLTYTGTDSGGLAVSTNRVVKIVNNALPVITLVGGNSLSLIAGSTYTDPGYSASDLEDGDITASVVVSGLVNPNVVGDYDVTYSVTDSYNNTTSVVRTVTITANTVPTITLTAPLTVLVTQGDLYVEPGYAANDTEDGDITGNVTVSGLPDTSTLGDYTITYMVTDAQGLTASATRAVSVVANNAPTIVLLGDNPYSLIEGQQYVDPGYTATDTEDGDITGDVVLSGGPNTNQVGTYTTTYSVTDSHGATTTANRTVNVTANDVPVLTLLGDNPLEINEGTVFTDPGYTATDAQDGDITANVVTTGDIVDTNVVGSYTITYTITDSSGTSDTEDRIVNVLSANIAPVITLIGDDPLVSKLGEAIVDPGATASDAEDGDITADITATDNVDVNTAGDYTIIYSVTDSYGATTTASRTVTVSNYPVITLTADVASNTDEIYVEQFSVYVDPGFTATDTEDGDVSANVTITGNVDTSTEGAYDLSYSVTDTDGNVTVVVRTVHVVSSLDSPITLIGDNPMAVTNVSGYTEPGATATDVDGTDISGDIIISGTVDTNTNGSYDVVYTITNSYGRNATQTRTVSVTGNPEAPVITLIGDNPINFNLTPKTIPLDNILSGGVIIGETWQTFASPEYPVDNTDPAKSLIRFTYDQILATSIRVPSYSIANTKALIYRTSDNLLMDTIVSGANGLIDLGSSANLVVTEEYDVGITALTEDSPLAFLDVVIDEDTAYVEPGYTASDVIDGDITGSVVVDASALDITVAGSYDIAYAVTNSNNLTGTATRTVDVVDNNDNPLIALIGNAEVNVTEGQSYTEENAIASDPEDGDISANIVISGDTVDVNTLGTYIVVYTITDANGAMDVIKRKVNVIANTAPVITLIPSAYYEWDSSFSQEDLTVDFTGVDAHSIAGNGTITNVSADSFTVTPGARVVHEIPVTHRKPYTCAVEFTMDGTAVFDGGDHVTERCLIGFYYGDNPVNPETDDQNTPMNTIMADIAITSSGDIDLYGKAFNSESVQAFWPPATVTDNPVPAHDNTTVWKVVYEVIADDSATLSLYMDGNIIKQIEYAHYTSDEYNPAKSNMKAILFQQATVDAGVQTTDTVIFSNVAINTPMPPVWVDPGYTATDAEDGDITANVIVAGDVPKWDEPGMKIPTYSVTDSSGGQAFKTRSVVVKAEPILTLTSVDTNIVETDARTWTRHWKISLADTEANGNIEVAKIELLDTLGNPMLQAPFTSSPYDESLTPELAFDGSATTSGQVATAPDSGFIGREVLACSRNPAILRITNPTVFSAGASNANRYRLSYQDVGLGRNVSDVGWWQSLSVDFIDFEVDASGVTEIVIDYTAQEDRFNAHTVSGYTGTDYDNTDITGKVEIGNPPLAWLPGTYVTTFDLRSSVNYQAPQQTRTYVVAAEAHPEITLLGDNPFTMDTGSSFTEPGYTASDAEDGDLTPSVFVFMGDLDTSTEGQYPVYYSVSDANGVPATATRYVNVVTPSNVAIALTAFDGGAITPVTIPEVEGDFYKAIGSDAAMGNAPLNTHIALGIEFDVRLPMTLGAEDIWLVAEPTDALAAYGTNDNGFAVSTKYSDNTISCNFQNSDFTITVPAGANLQGAYVGIKRDANADITTYLLEANGSMTVGSSSVSYPVGLYLSIVQNTANAAEVRGLVVDGNYVNDQTSWSTGVAGDWETIAELAASYTDPGATATIGGADATASITTVDNVDILTPGVYTVEHTITDGTDTETVTRTVTVTALQNGPTITLLGDNPLTLTQNATYTDPGATAMGAGGDITADIVVSGDTVDNTTIGTYNVIYTITDAYGSDSVTRVVEVIAGGAGSITLLAANDSVATPLTYHSLYQDVVTYASNLPIPTSYLRTGLSFTGDFDVSIPITSDNHALVLVVTSDPADTQGSGSANGSIVRLNNNMDYDAYGTASNLPLDATAGEWGAIAGVRRSGNQNYIYRLLPNGTRVEVEVDNDTSEMHLILYTTGAVANTSGLMVDGSLVVDTAAWTMDDPAHWDTITAGNVTWVDPGHTASDGVNPTTATITGDTVDLYTNGTYNITYTVTDTNGDDIVEVRQVIVDGNYTTNLAPVVVSDADATVDYTLADIDATMLVVEGTPSSTTSYTAIVDTPPAITVTEVTPVDYTLEDI